jgi:hypothetical protein
MLMSSENLAYHLCKTENNRSHERNCPTSTEIRAMAGLLVPEEMLGDGWRLLFRFGRGEGAKLIVVKRDGHGVKRE